MTIRHETTREILQRILMVDSLAKAETDFLIATRAKQMRDSYSILFLLYNAHPSGSCVIAELTE
jgi:hypothetical protein